jgi:ABC-type cobalamin transport system permease subunit
MDASCKQFRKQGLLALSAYAVVVVASIVCLEKLPLHGWKYVVAIAPVFPALLFVRTFLNFLATRDEMEVRIHLQGFAFAFAGTAILTLTYGFLENAGLPQLNWVWVWPLMGTLWMIGAGMATRKYR